MTLEPITTRTAKIGLEEDGLIRVVVLPEIPRHNLEVAQENMAAIAKFAAGEPRPVLIDMRAMLGIDREARAYYAKGGGMRVATAVALLTGSPVSQVIANFLISLNRPRVPVRLFTSEDEAITWLKNFSE